MVTKCANPSCLATFNHREGRLFRFPKQAVDDGRPANTHSVQHFWLCGDCFPAYRLEYNNAIGVSLARHFEGSHFPSPGSGPRKLIAAA